MLQSLRADIVLQDWILKTNDLPDMLINNSHLVKRKCYLGNITVCFLQNVFAVANSLHINITSRRHSRKSNSFTDPPQCNCMTTVSRNQTDGAESELSVNEIHQPQHIDLTLVRKQAGPPRTVT